MLPGFSGHLVSEAYLETLRGSDRDPGSAERARRDLTAWRRRCDTLGPASSLRSMVDTGAAPLVAHLGFDTLTAVETAGATAAATLGANSATFALMVVGWGAPLDPLWRAAVMQAMRRGAPWALLFNGVRLRLLDARRLFTRRYAEFDLDAALDDPRSFQALWTLVNAAALDRAGTPESLAGLIVASDRHASGVCRSLREGVLSASTDVFGALAGRRSVARAPSADDAFEQALTIVYRLLFLLFAEARALVPVWHPVYRESYSLDSLRVTAERLHGGSGLWDALRAIARLAHAGCRAGDLRVTPFNGRLFAPGRTPLAERADLDDGAARRAVLALATRPAADGVGRERIAYRDLGVEQLGAVYETLLDYRPHVFPEPGRHRRRAPVRVALLPGAGGRKTTGTFYTPQAIAEHLVRQTLAPLVRDLPPERILALRVVDPAMGSGAFLVAACRYLAGVYEAALIRAGGCHAADIGEPERALMRRIIAERCLYGVDVNPMAVQLARLSMWLTTLAADRPLSFLDHRLQVGDSLLGAWLSSLRHAPHLGRRGSNRAGTLPLFDDGVVRDLLQEVVPGRFSIETVPNDTLEQVRSKERTLSALAARDGSLSRWKRVADLWCASWFSKSAHEVPAAAFAELSDAILAGRGALPAKTADQLLDAAEDVARTRRFFHWELEFPEVFFDADGSRRDRAGFDAVVGNPPWDMIRADAGPAHQRAALRDAIGPVVRFTRDAGVYHAQSDGHPNRYQLFLERAIALTRTGGRLGLVLPTGLATDRGSAPLRRLLLTVCDIDAIIGFDNRRAVFPIHRSVGFLLLTASAGAPTGSIACRIGLDDAAVLESMEDEPAAAANSYPVRLTPALLQLVSGDDLAIPLLRTSLDVTIVERASTLFPPLGSERGWSARFGRELNATDDRPCFRPPTEGLRVVEGKLLEPFRVDLNSARHGILVRDARRLLADRRYEHPRLAYRDVASSTNRLTLIAAVIPGGCVSTHTLFCLRTRRPSRDQHFLCGLFNSFVVNYLVRARVTTHVTTGAVERLPIPTRDRAPGAYREIAALARVLARRFDEPAYSRLQARVARLYQLSAAEFEHVLATFPLIPERQRQAALDMFATGSE